MVRINRNVLLNFGFIYALEDRQAVPNTRDAHLLELVMFQGHKCFSHYFVFCIMSDIQQATRRVDDDKPKNALRY